MGIKQTTLFPPPVRDSSISDPQRKYLFSLQNLHPLVEVDTSAGNVVIALPNAGLTNSQTGQSNQNQEITYVKTSADGNTVTLTGAIGGNQVLTTQSPNAGSCVRFKSNATGWYLVGKI
jgi:glucose dehydrogenase